MDLYGEAIKQIYSETVLDHGQNPKNLGISVKSNAFSIIFDPCGDAMAVWLYIENNNITDISFTTDGCMTSLAAGSMVTELRRGRTSMKPGRLASRMFWMHLVVCPKKENTALYWR